MLSVQNFRRHPAQVSEGMDVTIKKCFHGAAFDILHVHGPGKTKRHAKGVNRGGGAVRLLNLKITEINLGLPARFGLKSYEGQTGLLLFLFPS